MKAPDDFMEASTGPSDALASDSPGVGRLSTPRDTSSEQREPTDKSAQSGVFGVLAHFLDELLGSTEALIEVYADRARWSVRRTVLKVLAGAAAWIAITILMSTALLSVLRGVCGGISQMWQGRTWLGDLAGGLLTLTFVAVVAAAYLGISSHRELRRLRAKYEQLRNEHTEERDSPQPAEHGGSTA